MFRLPLSERYTGNDMFTVVSQKVYVGQTAFAFVQAEQ